MKKALVSPAHVFLNPIYGSESSWAYNIVARLAKRFSVQLDVVCGKAYGLTLLWLSFTRFIGL
jgi:hypothetical protein